MKNIKDMIVELEEQIFAREVILKEKLDNEHYFILDREVVDDRTFETVRKATEKEIIYFYEIRLMQLKIKELNRNA
jgi:hypothetical protein